MNSDLKIISLKPALGANPLLMKSLKGGITYQFSKDFIVGDSSISYIPSYPEDLFKVNNMTINISAIAGKNGSGKSALFELFFAGLYNLAVKEGILDTKPKSDTNIKEQIPPTDVFFDLLYKLDNDIFHVFFRDMDITYRKYSGIAPDYREFPRNTVSLPFNDITFFYSIVINYSFYALNTNDMGGWLGLLFHKNDGYQTPVVINPWRKKGNIDINREKELVMSRLLFILLQPFGGNVEKSLLHLAPGKIARKLVLILDEDKFRKAGMPKLPKHKKVSSEFLFSYRMRDVYDRFLGKRNFKPQENLWNFYAQFYVMYKLRSITENYDIYKEKYQSLFKKHLWNGKREEREQLFRGFLNDLYLDDSHITFKLRRAINFLNYDFYSKNKMDVDISFEKLSELTLYHSKEQNIPVINLLPPPLFTLDIYFDHGAFSDLSSGEKQKIYGTYSIVYHLINLNSVGSGLRKYRHVSCILDEIELYYHPDMQRTYVHDLLDTLRKTHLPEIDSINFNFITHSPFILSDIPKNNVLYLQLDENRESLPAGIEQESFGANIYDLLANSFYFEHGFIGQNAKLIIQRVIDSLQKDIEITNPFKEEDINAIIKMIGEPFLKDKLLSMFQHKFNDRSPIEREIEELQNRIKRLRK
ncbi:hypothetical protein [Pedobacter psychrotolerans]|nr:hypothetical protein [Pedobacter psychrotolerans]